MRIYKVGDVIVCPVSYMDGKTGIYTSTHKYFVIVNISENTNCATVACTSQMHQSNNYKGIVVKFGTKDSISMGMSKDTFIYANVTQEFELDDIIRRKGYCPRVQEIIELLKDNN